MESNIILGVDIGGSGIKGALIDSNTGKVVSERIRIETPQPASPKAVAETVDLLVKEIGYEGSVIGCGFPAIIVDGVAKSAANIHDSWIGVNVETLLSEKTNKQVFVLNDADSAGVAELNYGAMKDMQGVTILLTLGTGIGSALFTDGQLVPNSEFGHLYLKDQKKTIEKTAANAVRKKKNLSYEDWVSRLNKLLKHLGGIFSPKLIVLGGGVSKKFEDYKKYINTNDFDFEVKPATLLNQAGLVGAAMYAVQRCESLASQDI